MKTLNILGTDYTYKTNCDEKDYPLLKVNEAYTDHSTKEIIVSKREHARLASEEKFYNKVNRHEIIHAMLYESGLDCNTDWACNEEMVDWFAIQYPKLKKIYKELGIEE